MATLVPAIQSYDAHGRKAPCLESRGAGPVTGATHTYLTHQCMNFHFTFPARLAPPLLRPFQVLVPAIVVARRYWDCILARHTGRDGPSQPKPALVLLPQCDAIMHP